MELKFQLGEQSFRSRYILVLFFLAGLDDTRPRWTGGAQNGFRWFSISWGRALLSVDFRWRPVAGGVQAKVDPDLNIEFGIEKP